MVDVAIVMEEPLEAWRTLWICDRNTSTALKIKVDLLEFSMVLVFFVTFNLYRCAYMILFPFLFGKVSSQKNLEKYKMTKGVKSFYWIVVFGDLFNDINV
jgi:hypothetical protein